MKIATFNANSIRSRLPILLQWMDRHQPDVLGIQETKVQDADFPREAIESAGWHTVFKGEKSYNGVALICKTEPKDVKFGFDDGGPSDETRLVRAVVDGVSIVNTYVPQGRAIDHVMYKYKLSWYARLKSCLDRSMHPVNRWPGLETSTLPWSRSMCRTLKSTRTIPVTMLMHMMPFWRSVPLDLRMSSENTIQARSCILFSTIACRMR